MGKVSRTKWYNASFVELQNSLKNSRMNRLSRYLFLLSFVFLISLGLFIGGLYLREAQKFQLAIMGTKSFVRSWTIYQTWLGSQVNIFIIRIDNCLYNYPLVEHFNSRRSKVSIDIVPIFPDYIFARVSILVSDQNKIL